MHLTDEQLAELIDGADAESTKKQIRYALGRLEAFARFSGTVRCRSFRDQTTGPVSISILWRLEEE